MEREIKNINELGVFAEEFLRGLTKKESGATIVGLSGDLGSGKTAFVKALVKTLGIDEEVLSPTFVIAKFYALKHPNWSQLVHVDCYRIEDTDELRALKWESIMSDPKNLVFVEWPEQIGAAFPADATMLKFQFINEETRVVTTEAYE